MSGEKVNRSFFCLSSVLLAFTAHDTLLAHEERAKIPHMPSVKFKLHTAYWSCIQFECSYAFALVYANLEYHI